jgi:hypothetical protein
MTRAGYLRCGAFTSQNNATNLADIYNQNRFLYVPTGRNNITMTIDNLIANTQYRILCYTEDFFQHIIPYAVAVQ